MSLTHCVQMVAQGDPDRHAVARAASDAAQARLYPLYALNLEIARAAWASTEPLVCEMRLQWWADALEALGQGGTVPPHPVLEACGFLRGDAAAAEGLAGLIEARRRDVWAEPFADADALWAHLGATGGALMWLAARALGADPQAEPVVRGFGTGAALAAWLQAVPALMAQGRQPLPDPGPGAVSDLALEGIGRIAFARARRRLVPRAALAALLTGAWAGAVLGLAVREPERVAAGRLAPSEFARRGALAWRGLTGLW
ncbi:MAG: squalene/phytoene synthase family protein [Gemmobacter sp.]|uniref:squalene/phytoene synthase family protein n=1 Tax=Gemmobacter sp. TaxID=1898957 RepID=UPI00391D3529